MRVVLEEEWTKARQGTEEGCCWDARDKVWLDGERANSTGSQFLWFIHFG